MKKALVAFLKFYRKYVSPLFPPVCRFYPSCSAYAIGAIEKYGALKGSRLALGRLLRCNPFSDGGYDPVK